MKNRTICLIIIIIIIIIIINIYIAQISFEYVQMREQTNMIQIKHNKLRIPTRGRLTSWLFTRHGRVEFGATEDKSIQWQGGGFEPGTSGFQVQRPTTKSRSPPVITLKTDGNFGNVSAGVLFSKVAYQRKRWYQNTT